MTRTVGWLHSSPGGAACLGVLVGLGAGGGAIVFRYLIVWVTEAFSGTHDYAGAGRVPNPHVPWLGIAFVVVAPAIGGLLYGPLIARFAPEARGHGVPEVMYAVSERGGRIGARVAIVKSLASALCIGSGGSVGREGPIVQIGSALGFDDRSGRSAFPPARMRSLVACGAAGGISATFNAPIAGVMFSLELILRSFEAELFAVVVLASVAADVVGRAAFGDNPFLPLANFRLVSVAEYPLYVGLGLSRRRSSASPSHGCCTPSRICATVSGRGERAFGPRRADCCSACFSSHCPRCTASATRSSSARSPAAT